ncbi:MAG: class E sortase [Actinomycetota bacterium]
MREPWPAGRRPGRAVPALLAAVVLAVAAPACGAGGDARRAGPGPSTTVARGAEPLGHTPATTAVPYQPLPIPVVIPRDSYAPEPVVEYGTIEIPKIGLVHRMYQGVTLHNIDLGPSHWTGSATPGERGNAVVAGHRSTHSQPFRRVDELAPGDEVVFRVDGVRSTYQVTDSFVVWPEAVWIANQTHEKTATLYACHPPGSEAQRYVVRLGFVSSVPETETA